jgi:hypothetical protein
MLLCDVYSPSTLHLPSCICTMSVPVASPWYQVLSDLLHQSHHITPTHLEVPVHQLPVMKVLQATHHAGCIEPGVRLIQGGGPQLQEGGRE